MVQVRQVFHRQEQQEYQAGDQQEDRGQYQGFGGKVQLVTEISLGVVEVVPGILQGLAESGPALLDHEIIVDQSGISGIGLEGQLGIAVSQGPVPFPQGLARKVFKISGLQGQTDIQSGGLGQGRVSQIQSLFNGIAPACFGVNAQSRLAFLPQQGPVQQTVKGLAVGRNFAGTTVWTGGASRGSSSPSWEKQGTADRIRTARNNSILFFSINGFGL